MPASINMLQDIRITTESWLRMIKRQGHIIVLQTDLEKYSESLTKLTLLVQHETRKTPDFLLEYKRKREQWEKFKHTVYEIVGLFPPDHEEEAEDVIFSYEV